MILVVEDDDAVRNGMSLLLRRLGHQVIAAATVAEAGSMLDSAAPTHVLLDLNLPDGVGTDVLRRIRGQDLPIRVALVTAAMVGGLLDEARGLGVDAVFIKPPQWEQVIDWVVQT